MTIEAGTETAWDTAMREGRAQAIRWMLDMDYEQAWMLARNYRRPRRTGRVRLAQWLLRRETQR
jgi:hypothetical protein